MEVLPWQLILIEPDKDNLMRAFAGESQARNRYTFAASQAKKEHHHVIEAIFKFTADQRRNTLSIL